MDIAGLTAFREVAVHGSITAAARSLRYTQSAVSRQIAALEESLGMPLFDRGPRGVRLTDGGSMLLEHAEAVLDRLTTARRNLSALQGLNCGRLRIGAFATAEAVLVPRAMAAFRAEHPGVELALSDGVSAAQVARLRAGELDVAVLNVHEGQSAGGAPGGAGGRDVDRGLDRGGGHADRRVPAIGLPAAGALRRAGVDGQAGARRGRSRRDAAAGARAGRGAPGRRGETPSRRTDPHDLRRDGRGHVRAAVGAAVPGPPGGERHAAAARPVGYASLT